MGASNARVPRSDLATNLEWAGVALSDPSYTFWGASPIDDDEGFTHLFVARWPEPNVDPAWRRSSEIAHYVAPAPDGPFEFREVVIKGTGRTGEWGAFGPHNPEIKRVGDRYALFYIANTDFHQPPHPFNQSIGLMLSNSLDGPWKSPIGNRPLLEGSADTDHFTHGRQVVNPAFLELDGKYLLYFKTMPNDANGTAYGVAEAACLEGPYRLPDRPCTGSGITIEDACVFRWRGGINLITTDNLGDVTGLRGGGALWESDDGVNFSRERVSVAYERIEAYRPDLDLSRTTRIYGPDPKLERPKVLIRNGSPAFLYAPSGWAVHGGSRTGCYVLRVNHSEV